MSELDEITDEMLEAAFDLLENRYQGESAYEVSEASLADVYRAMRTLAPTSPPRAPVATGWAVQKPTGEHVIVIGSHVTEDQVWEKAYSYNDLFTAKRRGARAFRVEVFVVEEEPK